MPSEGPMIPSDSIISMMRAALLYPILMCLWMSEMEACPNLVTSSTASSYFSSAKRSSACDPLSSSVMWRVISWR